MYVCMYVCMYVESLLRVEFFNFSVNHANKDDPKTQKRDRVRATRH